MIDKCEGNFRLPEISNSFYQLDFVLLERMILNITSRMMMTSKLSSRDV